MRARVKSAALIGLGVAIGAFIAVPASHLIGHRDDHIHVGGTIVYVGPDDPRAAAHHAPGKAHSTDSSPTPTAPGGDDARSDPPPSHEGGSLAHFAASVTSSTSAPALVAPRASDQLEPPPAPLDVEPSRPWLENRRARAPPASAPR